MVFTCKRCGYETIVRQALLKHLQKKYPCIVRLEDIPMLELWEEAQYIKEVKEGALSCDGCHQLFNDRSNLHKHKKVCKSNSVEALHETSKLIDENRQLRFEIQKLKNKKDEPYYQTILERYYSATHKKLNCGVTDITTDTFHAEIKEWPSWKEAFGQLMVYNTEDPRDNLICFFFGKYSQRCKDIVKLTADKVGYKVYDIIECGTYLHIVPLGDGDAFDVQVVNPNVSS